MPELYAYFSGMTTAVIIGTGNVARHLFEVFHTSGQIKVVQVAGRNIEALSHFKEKVITTQNLENLEEADVYVLAVSDDAIGQIAEQLLNKKALLVHTSGSTPLSILPPDCRRGVFYPLQTFSRELDVDFKTIPICIEAETENDYQILEKIVSAINSKFYRVSSGQRLHLHTAAVFVNNFTNHLYHVGYTLCEKEGLSREILKPLIKETLRKIDHMTPYDAQTGPARRGDSITMKKQIDLIDQPYHKGIYDSISKSIQATYAEKL